MKNTYQWVAPLGAAIVLVALYASQAQPQDPTLNPTYGSVKLKSGFTPDPLTIKLTAGGEIKTTLGGVTAHVANAPDFQLNYTAGKFPLTIYVHSKEDTTLLINLPNSKWVANDDGGKDKNPRIHLKNPLSGRYDIYVGTFRKGNVPATLHISELK